MEAIKIVVADKVFDLGTLDEVKLAKIGEFTPAASVEEALSMLGNDQKKVLEIINKGLQKQAENSLLESSAPWHTFKLDEQGEETEEVNGVYEGNFVAGDKFKTVQNFVLNLAKTMKGYHKGMSIEDRRKAKQETWDFVRQNPQMLAALTTK